MKKTSTVILMATTIVGAVIAKSLSPLSMQINGYSVSSAQTDSVSLPVDSDSVSLPVDSDSVSSLPVDSDSVPSLPVDSDSVPSLPDDSDSTADSLAVVVSDKSVPLTFTNDSVYPWTIGDGYLQNWNCSYRYSKSKLSVTFTIDEISKFSFQSRSGYYYNYDNDFIGSHHELHESGFYINGELYGSGNYSDNFVKSCFVLTPGTYTVEWVDTIMNKSYYGSTINCVSQIKNIELSSNWINIDLAKAGTLGVEVLYKVDVLNDVELLKVSGNLNSDDWTTINNMNNLTGLDLSDAKFNSVPGYAFSGLSYLSYVVLPEGVAYIGDYAFKGTQILDIDIPSTVTSIGQYAFAGTSVRSVNFKEDSKLKYIGKAAFNECTSLKQFIMPNTVTELGENNYGYNTGIFYWCTNLEKLYFSDALSTVGFGVCQGCSNLKEVHLPQSVVSIDGYAFYETLSLRKINLPASLKEIGYSAFEECGIDSIKWVYVVSCG